MEEIRRPDVLVIDDPHAKLAHFAVALPGGGHVGIVTSADAAPLALAAAKAQGIELLARRPGDGLFLTPVEDLIDQPRPLDELLPALTKVKIATDRATDQIDALSDSFRVERAEIRAEQRRKRDLQRRTRR